MNFEPHTSRSLGLVALAAWRWGTVLCVFALLVGFGLFYSWRRQLHRLGGARTALKRKLLDEEFREELRVTAEYLVLLATVPLLAAAVGAVRAVHRFVSGLARAGRTDPR